MTEQEILMERGDNLAAQCVLAQVPDNHLGTVLAHLKRHRDPKATARMLDELVKSPFARRFGKTGEQLEGLRLHVGSSLRQARDWQEAAQVVGWAKRLMAVRQLEKLRQKPSRSHDRNWR